MKKRIAFLVLFTLASLLMVDFSAAADASNLEELSQILNDVSAVMNTLVNNGFVIEHLELDSMGVDETYRIPYPFYEGLEYIIVGIGGPAIADLDVYVLDQNGDLVVSNTDAGRISAVTMHMQSSTLYHSLFHAYSLAEGYSEDMPYYFAFVIAAR